MVMLEQNLLTRYERQLTIDQIGVSGQEKLQATSILVIGAGGLGSHALYALTALGIGTLGIVDKDSVQLSNLNRQILYGVDDLGKAKVQCASKQLHFFSPHTRLETYEITLNKDNGIELLSQYDLVLNCVDNLETRYCVNAICQKLMIPHIEAGIQGFNGYVATFKHGENSPCYTCLNPHKELSTKTSKESLVTSAAIAATYQANEALKVILGIGDSLVSNILVFDLLYNTVKVFPIEKKKNCPVCASH